MNMNNRAFVSSLTPEQAKDFLMQYFDATSEEQEHILEKDGLKYTLTKLKDIIDKRLIIRETSFTIEAGQTSIDTGLTELGSFTELYINGRRMYPSSHYTVDTETGIINLKFTPEYDMEGYVADSKLNRKMSVSNADTLQGFGLDEFITKTNFTDELVKLRRYDEVPMGANASTVQSKIVPLSGRPTVIIDGKFAILGKDYELTDREQGIITIKNPPSTNYTVVINDMTFASGSDISNAQTFNGLAPTAFVRGNNIYEFDTLGSAKSATYLMTNDKVRVWGNNQLGDNYVTHYLVIHDEEPDSIALTNGLFLRPLTFITTSELGSITVGTDVYKPTTLTLSQYSEVYVNGSYRAYGRDWTIHPTLANTIKFSQVQSTNTNANICVINRTDTQTVDITTLDGKTSEDFVNSRREFSFTDLTTMKAYLSFQIGDRISLWGETKAGDCSLRQYIVQSENTSGAIALSGGVYAKEVLNPTTKVYTENSGNIPVAWFTPATGTLDMHGYTHANIGSAFDLIKPFTIKRIINVPKVSNVYLSFNGVRNDQMSIECNTGSTPTTEKNIINSAETLQLASNASVLLYRTTEDDGRCIVTQHFPGI